MLKFKDGSDITNAFNVSYEVTDGGDAETHIDNLAGYGVIAVYQTPDTSTINVSVRGTAVSWNAANNAEYLLYDGSTSDADIKAEWKTGTYKKALAYTPVKGGITANSDGRRYDQTFSFSAVTPGSYKLAIFKPGKYVPKIVSLTVGTTDYTCGQLKLWLYGDVNYDGKVKPGDATQILKYVALKRTLTAEELLAADVNDDGKVKSGDATQILKYVALKNSAFDYMK